MKTRPRLAMGRVEWWRVMIRQCRAMGRAGLWLAKTPDAVSFRKWFDFRRLPLWTERHRVAILHSAFSAEGVAIRRRILFVGVMNS